MAQLGVYCPRGTIGWEECLGSCAHNPLRPCDYSADMLNLMRRDYSDDDAEPGVESFTPTRLLGCVRQPVIMGESDYYVDVEQAYPATRGNMIHALMEKATYPGALTVVREHRFHQTIMTKHGPQPFTGKTDLVVVKSVRDGVIKVKIEDYKSIGEIGHDMLEAKQNHQLQINMYAWLVSKELPELLDLPTYRVDVDELEIIYVSMKKKRRFTSAGELRRRGKRLTVKPLTYETITLKALPLWGLNQTGKYIRSKIEERLEAEVKLPDILEGDDAWLCNYCPIFDVCHQIGNVDAAM
jgi:hypothetical protein